jgi:RNA polymerase primary sigma factor
MSKRPLILITSRITDRSSITFKKYLADLTNIGLFTANEEYECALKAANGDREAKAELVTRNLRFVVSIAKVYTKSGADLEDLVNEGNMGLIEAAEKYDPTMGNKFITYAVWYIRRRILSYTNINTNIRVPINKKGDLDRLNKRLSLKEQELCRPATYEDLIADATTSAEVAELVDLMGVASISVTSMDKPLDLGDGVGSMYELIADDTFGDADQLVTKQDTKRLLVEAIGRLKPLHQRVIIKRFGLDGSPSMTLTDCGNEDDISISRERVRQIEKSALKELKHVMMNYELDLV